MFLLMGALLFCIVMGADSVTAQTTDDHGDLLNDATNLPLGSSVAGRIDPGDDQDVFRLDLSGSSGNTHVWIYTTGDLDTLGGLHDSNGDLIAGNDDTSTSDGVIVETNFRIPRTLAPGVYYVSVRSADRVATGYYTLHATADDHGHFNAAATTLALGDSVAGRIDHGFDRDVFKLDLSDASGTTDVWIYTTGDLDTRGWMYDANGNLLVFNNDSYIVGRETNFSLRKNLPRGVYYILVRSWLTADGDYPTGDYTLHAEAVTGPGNTTGTAIALSLDFPTPGLIDTGNDSDYFRIVLDESKSLVIYALSPVLLDGVRDPWLREPLHGTVLDDTGTEIPVNVHDEGIGFKIMDGFSPGTYHVKVTAPASDTIYPVPYTIHAYEDTDYTDFIDGCEAASAALNNPQIDDPLYGCQWHLNNGEGEDINVEPVWSEGLDGEGVHIAVVDDTVDYSHEDLAQNVNSFLSHDYGGMGGAYRPFDHHGTAVAGIIAARGNSVGVRGVAPGATIYGYNYLAGDWQQFEDINRADAMGRNRVATAVSNNSWGPPDGPWLGEANRLWELAVDSGIREGYDGKGTFYVFAGGNGGRGHRENPDGTLVGGHIDNVRGRGDDSNLEEVANYYAVTAVCAVNDGDVRSVYSEKGANLWVCAPSKDSGEEEYRDHRGIVTTENSDRYRSDFDGTSASAPIVSGVAALLRQANPDLTWLDLKLILAASARKNDATNPGWEDGARKYGASSSEDRYHFNHEYGFGMVDVGAAVDLARGWTNAPPLESASAASRSATTILPPSGSTPRTVTTTLALSTGIRFTEFVEINTDFEHTSFRDMEIKLVSPSGVVSTLTVPFNTRHYTTMCERPDGSTYDCTYYVRLDGEFRFGSARHLGEDPNGVWTLRLTDHFPIYGGTLRSWSIKVHGHVPAEPAASSDATLSSLTVGPVDIAGFYSNVTEYHVGVANDVSQIDIIPTANHPGATIRWGVHEITSGVGRAFSILEGLSVFEFTVTAQDNSTTKTYTVNVARGSGAPFGWKVTDDFNDLGLDSNVYPTGIWSNGNTMWVACKTENNNIPANLCSYSMATKERGSNFHTLGTHGNNNPQGITSDGTTMWVADVSDKRIYAYRLSTYARNPSREINLAVAGILQPRGITVEPVLGGFWVANNADPDLLYAYNRYTLKRIPRADFGTLAAARNASPSGIWTDGTTMWVADRHASKLYAYDMHTKARVPSKDFNSLIAAGNTDPWGIWSDGTTMWVADISKKKIFSYNMPDDTDAALSELTVSPVDIEGFQSGVTAYHVGVANDVTGVTITPTATGPGATIAINGSAITSGSSHSVSLAEGKNDIRITVTAGDGRTTEVYTVTVGRAVAAEYGWNAVKDFNTLYAAGNDYPTGIWSDGTTMWVADWTDEKIYAYSVATKARDSSRDFNTLNGAGNDHPVGIWSNGTTMWVVDNSDDKIYAYDLVTRSRAASNDFDTLAADNQDPASLWSDGTTMWVLDALDEKIYAYDLATKAIDVGKELSVRNLPLNSLVGMWADGATMWVADTFDDTLLARNWSTKARDLSKDFTTLNDAGNTQPRGIWSDGETMWVVEMWGLRRTEAKIYAYNMPVAVQPTPPPDATLSSLTASPVDIGGFSSDVTEYHVGVANSVTQASITATASDADAIIDVNGSVVPGGSPHAVSLTEGRNEVTITVTASDEQTVETYTIVIGRGVTTAYGWKATDDFNAFAAGNNYPSGLWSDGTTMWVANYNNAPVSKIFAYDLSTKARDESKDFNTLSVRGSGTVSGNSYPTGIWSDGTTMWVADGEDAKLYAYDLSTKARDAAKDFDTLSAAGNNSPRGIWSDGETMWVVDHTNHDDKVFAYDLATKERDASKEIDTLRSDGNRRAFGIWSDGTTVWVGDSLFLKLYAYDLATKSRDTSQDFSALHPTLDYVTLGIWSDGVTMWVTDLSDRKIYSYNMPADTGTPATMRANRSFSPTSVDAGGVVEVTITASGYGAFGAVVETLPAGFDYVSSSLSDGSVTDEGQQLRFILLGETSFTYTLTAPSTVDSYSFSGVLRNFGGEEVPLGGASTLTVGAATAGDPLIDRYDANNNGTIDRSEVINAINDYLFGGTGSITRADVIRLINLYLFAPSTPPNPPGPPTGLTASGNGETQIDLRWAAPTTDGGAAITGYRIEIAEDITSWNDLVADTGSTATTYFHTSLTAGTTRHYRVSAINSAGTGPASNIATGTTDSSSNRAPDLVVDTPTVSDSTPAAGASFRLSATVRNQGDGLSGITALHYYRSTDSTITAADTQVGTDDLVFHLEASESSDKWTDLTAPSVPGAYYYGACVDAVSDESDTTNNCSTAVTVTVGAAPAPDLVVDTPTVSDSTPTAGASFTLSATVRNQGSGPSASSTLRYYRSTDAAITTGDTAVGTDSVGGLNASGTSPESISLTAPSTAGTYYYGACVDAVSGESNTGNNCSAAVPVTVRAAPAEREALVALYEATGGSNWDNNRNWLSNAPLGDWYGVDTDADGRVTSLNLRRNGLTGEIPPELGDLTSLESVHLHDNDLSGCVPVALRGVAVRGARLPFCDALAGGIPAAPAWIKYEHIDVSFAPDHVNVWWAETPGAYWYQTGKLGEVEAPATATIDGETCGFIFEFFCGGPPYKVRACNADGCSGWTHTLPLSPADVQYQRDGSTIVVSWSSVTNADHYKVYHHNSDSSSCRLDSSGNPSSCEELTGAVVGTSFTHTNPDENANYYWVVACNNAGCSEIDSANPATFVGGPPAPTSPPNQRYVWQGSTTVVSWDAVSGADHYTVYYDDFFSSSCSLSFGGSPSFCDELATNIRGTSYTHTSPDEDDNYYWVVACNSGGCSDIDSANSARFIDTRTPDLVMDRPTVDVSAPTAGASFTLSATVRNHGSGPSASSTLRYYRSADSTITTSDTSVGMDSVSGLDALETADESISLTAPSTPGTYYYGACVDAVSDESDTTNNCSTAVTVTVGAAPAPDLVVDRPTVDVSAPTAGASFTLSATVRNQGSGPSASSTLRYYRSADSTITTSDTSVGMDSVSGLDALETEDESISLTAPSTPGTYYYGACVDAVSDESDTTNNCSTAVTVTVGAAPAPDLVVDTPTVSDSTPTAGASFTLSATVRNQGSGPSASSTLRYYRSADSTISASDTQVGTDYVSGLNAFGSSAETVSVTAPSESGTYYYGVCVDEVSGESDTRNNCSAAVAVSVGAAPESDNEALCEAIYWGRTTTVQTLVDGGADVNATCQSETRSYNGKTPLFLAVDESENEILQILITAGADPNAGASTPLCEAIYWGRTTIVQTLVNGSADVNATCQSETRSYNGKTPLFLAVDESENEILQILITAGADPNAGASTPLCEAIYWGRTTIVQTLVNGSADVNATCQSETRSYNGKTPLFLAVDESENEILQILITAGADPNAGASTPLCEAIYWGRTTIVQTLVNGSADVNATCRSETRSYNGKTPLFLAKEEDENEIVQILTDAGAEE